MKKDERPGDEVLANDVGDEDDDETWTKAPMPNDDENGAKDDQPMRSTFRPKNVQEKQRQPNILGRKRLMLERLATEAKQEDSRAVRQHWIHWSDWAWQQC